MKFSLSLFLAITGHAAGQNSEYQPHYLVGLLNYPQPFIPEIFQGHTSGTYIPQGDEQWSSSPLVPFADVPGVGYSDLELYYDEEGNKVTGEYYGLSDNGKHLTEHRPIRSRELNVSSHHMA